MHGATGAFCTSLSFGSLQAFGDGYLLPNIVGCFLMGAANGCKELHWGRHGLLYTGLTTGLCGCLTTFATWNQAPRLGPCSHFHAAPFVSGDRIVPSGIQRAPGYGR